MKKLNLLTFCLILTVCSCASKEDAVVIPSLNSIAAPADYNALIVGKWQLSEIGTLTNPSEKCGTNNHDETTWTKTTDTEILEFKSTGDFIKSLKNDAVCKGNFQLKYGNLSSVSDCNKENIDQPINDLNTANLILEETNKELKIARYRYVKQ